MPEQTKRKRATAAEMEQRTTAVVTLLVGGAERSEIIDFAAKKWQIGRAATDSLIKRAREAITEESAPERTYSIGLNKRRLTRIYNQSMKVKNFNVAIAAVREYNTLFGLHQPQTVKIIAEMLTPADAKLLSDLLAALRAQGMSAGNVFAAMMEQIAAEQPNDG